MMMNYNCSNFISVSWWWRHRISQDIIVAYVMHASRLDRTRLFHTPVQDLFPQIISDIGLRSYHMGKYCISPLPFTIILKRSNVGKNQKIPEQHIITRRTCYVDGWFSTSVTPGLWKRQHIYDSYYSMVSFRKLRHSLDRNKYVFCTF